MRSTCCGPGTRTKPINHPASRKHTSLALTGRVHSFSSRFQVFIFTEAEKEVAVTSLVSEETVDVWKEQELAEEPFVRVIFLL